MSLAFCCKRLELVGFYLIFTNSYYYGDNVQPFGYTALITAARHGLGGVCRVLLAADADMEAVAGVAGTRETALSVAARRDDAAIVQVCLQAWHV